MIEVVLSVFYWGFIGFYVVGMLLIGKVLFRLALIAAVVFAVLGTLLLAVWLLRQTIYRRRHGRLPAFYAAPNRLLLFLAPPQAVAYDEGEVV